MLDFIFYFDRKYVTIWVWYNLNNFVNLLNDTLINAEKSSAKNIDLSVSFEQECMQI